MASPAPQDNLRRYAERMGWTDMPWYTIRTERFSADFGTDEWFGLNVFLRDGDDVYRTYFLQHGPMVQKIGHVWSVFSLTPYGGQGDDPSMRPRAGRGIGAEHAGAIPERQLVRGMAGGVDDLPARDRVARVQEGISGRARLQAVVGQLACRSSPRGRLLGHAVGRRASRARSASAIVGSRRRSMFVSATSKRSSSHPVRSTSSPDRLAWSACRWLSARVRMSSSHPRAIRSACSSPSRPSPDGRAAVQQRVGVEQEDVDAAGAWMGGRGDRQAAAAHRGRRHARAPALARAVPAGAGREWPHAVMYQPTIRLGD